jgi:hypothetical protein
MVISPLKLLLQEYTKHLNIVNTLLIKLTNFIANVITTIELIKSPAENPTKLDRWFEKQTVYT